MPEALTLASHHPVFQKYKSHGNITSVQEVAFAVDFLFLRKQGALYFSGCQGQLQGIQNNKSMGKENMKVCTPLNWDLSKAFIFKIFAPR